MIFTEPTGQQAFENITLQKNLDRKRKKKNTLFLASSHYKWMKHFKMMGEQKEEKEEEEQGGLGGRGGKWERGGEA